MGWGGAGGGGGLDILFRVAVVLHREVWKYTEISICGQTFLSRYLLQLEIVCRGAGWTHK